jgi:transcription-repair coupling factor (superfamily II helicase)
MSSTLNTSPALQTALQRVSLTPEYREVLAELNRGARVISISGLVTGSARALALAALQKETGRRFAIVAPATRDLEAWERDIRFWYCALAGKEGCDNEVVVLPASETDPYAGFSPHAETLEKRALALWRLVEHSQDFVLLTARALARKMVGPDEIRRLGTVLKRDQDFSPDELVQKLFATGYIREDPVGAVGEFSIRGGIVDVWPPGRDAPVRIEFFGDPSAKLSFRRCGS